MRTFHTILSFLAAAWFFPCLPISAQTLAGGGISILNKEVKKSNNQVGVNIDFKLDDLKVKSNKGTILIPMIINQGDTLKMPAVEIMGRKRYIYYLRNHKTATPCPLVVTKRNNNERQTIHYSYISPYRTWMDNSQLVIGQDVCGCNQSIVEEGLLCHAGEVLHKEPEKPKVCEKPKTKEIKIHQEKGTARLHFHVNKFFINTKLGNNDAEINKMCKTIDRVKNNTNVRIVSIILHGYASPDGNYDNNKRLAENRTKAVYEHLISIYPVEKNLIQFTSTAEDWQGVRDYIEKHDIPQKNIVLNIIDSDMTPDEKERAIALKAGEAHRYLIQKVYPQLRRTEYFINYEIKNEIIK